MRMGLAMRAILGVADFPSTIKSQAGTTPFRPADRLNRETADLR